MFWNVRTREWKKWDPHTASNVSILRSKSPYSVQMRENMDQKNFEYENFTRCAKELFIKIFMTF